MHCICLRYCAFHAEALNHAVPQARSTTADAEARADEASALTDRLLAEHYNEWVPHWVSYGYEKVVSDFLTVQYQRCAIVLLGSQHDMMHCRRFMLPII